MVRTCLPNHLRVLLRPPAVRAASGHQTDGAVAAADCQAVRRPGLHGQRLRMAAHAAKRPVHLPPPNEITKQARPACHTINTPGSAGTLGHPRDSGMRLLVHVERDWHRHATTVRAVELKVYSLHMTGRSAHLCCLPVETIRQHRHSPAEHRAVHADCQHPQRLCFRARWKLYRRSTEADREDAPGVAVRQADRRGRLVAGASRQSIHQQVACARLTGDGYSMHLHGITCSQSLPLGRQADVHASVIADQTAKRCAKSG